MKKRIYERAKKSYKEYESNGLLPVVDIIAFNDAHCSVTMKRINGAKYKDVQHMSIVIDFLFEYAKQALLFSKDNDEYLYFQHGDMKVDNIIWIDDTNYVFIDLDNMGYHPLLYDVLHLCYSLNLTLSNISEILEANSKKIQKNF